MQEACEQVKKDLNQHWEPRDVKLWLGCGFNKEYHMNEPGSIKKENFKLHVFGSWRGLYDLEKPPNSRKLPYPEQFRHDSSFISPPKSFNSSHQPVNHHGYSRFNRGSQMLPPPESFNDSRILSERDIFDEYGNTMSASFASEEQQAVVAENEQPTAEQQAESFYDSRNLSQKEVFDEFENTLSATFTPEEIHSEEHEQEAEVVSQEENRSSEICSKSGVARLVRTFTSPQPIAESPDASNNEPDQTGHDSTEKVLEDFESNSSHKSPEKETQVEGTAVSVITEEALQDSENSSMPKSPEQETVVHEAAVSPITENEPDLSHDQSEEPLETLKETETSEDVIDSPKPAETEKLNKKDNDVEQRNEVQSFISQTRKKVTNKDIENDLADEVQSIISRTRNRITNQETESELTDEVHDDIDIEVDIPLFSQSQKSPLKESEETQSEKDCEEELVNEEEKEEPEVTQRSESPTSPLPIPSPTGSSVIRQCAVHDLDVLRESFPIPERVPINVAIEPESPEKEPDAQLSTNFVTIPNTPMPIMLEQKSPPRTTLNELEVSSAEKPSEELPVQAIDQAVDQAVQAVETTEKSPEKIVFKQDPDLNPETDPDIKGTEISMDGAVVLTKLKVNLSLQDESLTSPTPSPVAPADDTQQEAVAVVEEQANAEQEDGEIIEVIDEDIDENIDEEDDGDTVEIIEEITEQSPEAEEETENLASPCEYERELMATQPNYRKMMVYEEYVRQAWVGRKGARFDLETFNGKHVCQITLKGRDGSTGESWISPEIAKNIASFVLLNKNNKVPKPEDSVVNPPKPPVQAADQKQPAAKPTWNTGDRQHWSFHSKPLNTTDIGSQTFKQLVSYLYDKIENINIGAKRTGKFKISIRVKDYGILFDIQSDTEKLKMPIDYIAGIFETAKIEVKLNLGSQYYDWLDVVRKDSRIGTKASPGPLVYTGCDISPSRRPIETIVNLRHSESHFYANPRPLKTPSDVDMATFNSLVEYFYDYIKAMNHMVSENGGFKLKIKLSDPSTLKFEFDFVEEELEFGLEFFSNTLQKAKHKFKLSFDHRFHDWLDEIKHSCRRGAWKSPEPLSDPGCSIFPTGSKPDFVLVSSVPQNSVRRDSIPTRKRSPSPSRQKSPPKRRVPSPPRRSPPKRSSPRRSSPRRSPPRKSPPRRKSSPKRDDSKRLKSPQRRPSPPKRSPPRQCSPIRRKRSKSSDRTSRTSRTIVRRERSKSPKRATKETRKTPERSASRKVKSPKKSKSPQRRVSSPKRTRKPSKSPPRRSSRKRTRSKTPPKRASPPPSSHRKSSSSKHDQKSKSKSPNRKKSEKSDRKEQKSKEKPVVIDLCEDDEDFEEIEQVSPPEVKITRTIQNENVETESSEKPKEEGFLDLYKRSVKLNKKDAPDYLTKIDKVISIKSDEVSPEKKLIQTIQNEDTLEAEIETDHSSGDDQPKILSPEEFKETHKQNKLTDSLLEEPFKKTDETPKRPKKPPSDKLRKKQVEYGIRYVENRQKQKQEEIDEKGSQRKLMFALSKAIKLDKEKKKKNKKK